MRDSSIPIDHALVEALAGPPVSTPSTTPAARITVSRTREIATGVERRDVHVFGGVQMDPAVSARLDREVDKAVKPIIEAARAAQAAGHSDFTVKLGGREFAGVSLPVAGEREVGSFSTTVLDLPRPARTLAGLPGLSRSYNSFHNEAGEFGHSWSLLLPRLDFQPVGKAGEERYAAVEGDPASKVRVQRFVVTDDFGITSGAFETPIVDQQRRRIAFRPVSVGRFVALYPEDRLYRAMFSDGKQALFDTEGRLRAMFAGGVSARYDYDGTGRLSQLKVNESGKQTSVEYQRDDQGRVRAIAADDERVEYYYSASGDLEQAETAAGSERYHYNPHHLLSDVETRGGRVLHNEYDEIGRLTAQRDSAGYQLKQTVTVRPDRSRTVAWFDGASQQEATYDANLRLTALTDGSGDVVAISYPDGVRKVLEMREGPQAGARAELLADDRPIELTNARGVRTSFRYADNGLLTEVSTGGRRQIAFGYDATGHVTALGYGDGSADRLTRDEAGRIIRLTRTTSASNAPEVLDLHYDQGGAVTELSHPALGHVRYSATGADSAVARSEDKVTYHRDPEGRVQSITGPGSGKLEFAYRVGGVLSRVSITHSGATGYTDFDQPTAVVVHGLDGSTTRFKVDAAGRLTGVEGPAGIRATYGYDEQGRLTAATFVPNRCIRYHYDRDSLLRDVAEGRCE